MIRIECESIKKANDGQTERGMGERVERLEDVQELDRCLRGE
jgi:hypothetical protein